MLEDVVAILDETGVWSICDEIRFEIDRAAFRGVDDRRGEPSEGVVSGRAGVPDRGTGVGGLMSRDV